MPGAERVLGVSTPRIRIIGEDLMAISWLRLWHEMPNDPKWRTIARTANEPIPSVIAVYVHLLVSASQAEPRGHQGIRPEDVASALGIETEDVSRILDAMQGRVLDGTKLAGWEKRQPAREDHSTDRVRNFRKRNVTQRNAQSGFGTHRNGDSVSEIQATGQISPFAQ